MSRRGEGIEKIQRNGEFYLKNKNADILRHPLISQRISAFSLHQVPSIHDAETGSGTKIPDVPYNISAIVKHLVEPVKRRLSIRQKNIL